MKIKARKPIAIGANSSQFALKRSDLHSRVSSHSTILQMRIERAAAAASGGGGGSREREPH